MALDSAEQAAARAARPVAWLRRRIVSAWWATLLGLVAIGAGTWMSGDHPWYALNLAPVVAALIAGAASVWSARPPEPQTFDLDAHQAAPLLALVAEVAAAMDVPTVDRAALSPGVGVWTELREQDDVVLVVGAPLLWHLTRAELRGVIAPAVATAACQRDRRVRGALDWVRRLIVAYGKWPPLLGRFRRRLIAAAEHQGVTLTETLAIWGKDRALSAGISSPDEELDLLAELWGYLLSKFAAGAYRRDRWPDQLGDGLAAMASQLSDQKIFDRTWDRMDDPRHETLDVAGLDRPFSEWLARDAGVSGLPVSWSDYPVEIIETDDREAAGELVTAVSTVSGQSIPATLEAVVGEVQRAPEVVGGWLATKGGSTAESAPSRDEVAATLGRHLAAMVSTALTDGGLATRPLDWIEPEILLDRDGHRLDLRATVAEAVASGRYDDLLDLVESAGLRRDESVFVSGVEPPAAPRYGKPVLGAVWYRSSWATPLVHDGALFLFAPGARHHWRQLPAQFAGRQRLVTDVLEQMSTPIDELAKQMPIADRVPLRDVLSVHLRARKLRYWKCSIRTSGQRVVFIGPTPAGVAASQLEKVFGDRLHVHGLGRTLAGQWTWRHMPKWRLMTSYLLLLIAAAALIFAAFVGAVMALGHHETATVVGCSYKLDRNGRSTGTHCEVFPADRGPSVVVDTDGILAPGSQVDIVRVHWGFLNLDEEMTNSKSTLRGLTVVGFVALLPGMLLASSVGRRRLFAPAEPTLNTV